MLSEDSIKGISLIFCGDTPGCFEYKTGGKLVRFFNQFYRCNDVYQAGFPSRWSYVYDKIIEFIRTDKFDNFINLILSKEYIMSESRCGEIEALKKSQKALIEFNTLLKPDLFFIAFRDNKYHLTKLDEDLVYIGGGGFANVYKQKSTGLIMKKLKDDYCMDSGIRSRFKREFEITKSLSDLERIIKVYALDEDNYSYTMEEAETTLKDYILGSSITEEMKITCIRQILLIMTEVHKRDIIHRDISPSNIFIIHGVIKIADFGLGKDLKVFTYHQTVHTNSFGQYLYCAPEQFMLLKDGDKQSDVYSLGRLINFIMTNDPSDSHHFLRSISEKATNQNSAFRYADAGQLLSYVEKGIKLHTSEINTNIVLDKISRDICDEEVENYIYEMSGSDICKLLLAELQGFSSVLIKFMALDSNHASYIIQSIESNYKEVCGKTFKAYDPFAHFAYVVLNSNFPFVINELAAYILRFVAVDVNRFSAQGLVDNLKSKGLEPLIEDILNT